MTRLAELFDSLDWTKLGPAQDLLAAQPGAEDVERWIAVARSSDEAVAYLPRGGIVEFREFEAPPRAVWRSPRTGETFPASKASNGLRFEAPSDLDWLLILRR